MHKTCNCTKESCEIQNEEENSKIQYFLTILGVIMLVFAIILKDIPTYLYIIMYALSYILIGYEIFFTAIKGLFKKDMFDENFLMTVATLGAFFIGDYKEGVAVLLFYKIGEFLQEKAIDNSKKKIQSALDIRPEYANLKLNNEITQVDPKQVNVDDVIVIKTGEKVPLDGIVIDGESKLDMSALNGESKPRDININDEILSGSINLGAMLTVKVTKTYEKSTISEIIELIQNATSKKSTTEKFITKFAKIYTPIVILMAVLLLVILPVVFKLPFSESLSRVLSFLVISCPCALVVSVPLGFFIGIGNASRNGIVIKGSNYLDILTNVKIIIFDKTGTLTKGKFEVSKIDINKNFEESTVIEYVAMAEYYSNHYIAKSIVKLYNKKIDESRIKSHEEIAGYGIKAIIDDKEILVGNDKFMKNSNIIFTDNNMIGTVVYISIDNEYAGNILLSDEIKEGCDKLVSKLKANGIRKCIMLTGDEKSIADDIAGKLQIDETYSKLLPTDKVNIVESIKAKLNNKEKLAFVGDGINDGPAIAMSDIGISMGKGSDLAIETSDVVLMTDDPLKIVDAIKICKKTKRVVTQNITFVLLVKITFLILSSLGMTTMWLAIFADVGVTLLTILYSFTIFIKRKQV